MVFTSDRGLPDRFFSCGTLYTSRSNGARVTKIHLPNSIPFPDAPQWGTARLTPGAVDSVAPAGHSGMKGASVCDSRSARLAVVQCRLHVLDEVLALAARGLSGF